MLKPIAFAALSFFALAEEAAAQGKCPSLQIQQTSGVSGTPGHITGTAFNGSGTTLTNAFVTFNLFDNSGALVGNSVASAQNLAPGQTWRFDALTAEPYARFSISDTMCVTESH